MITWRKKERGNASLTKGKKDISMKKQCDTITLNGGDGEWQK